MLPKDRLNCISILEAIQKIFEYTNAYKNADEFNSATRDFDATMMNFIVIGEMVVKMSDSFFEDNPLVDWYKIRGFRNIIAHNYFGIDAEDVWQIIQNDLPKLSQSIKAIIK